MRDLEEQITAVTHELEALGDPGLLHHWVQLQRAIVQREKTVLEQARRLSLFAGLGQNVAELVHEMRQPLLGIHAWSQLLQEQSSNAEFVTTNAKKIEQQAERLTHMLDRLRSHYRPSGSDAATTCDLNDAVSAALELLTPRIRERHARAATSLAREALPVPVGIVEMQQVLVNLVANAVDAVPESEGGIELSTRSNGEWVEATVQDNGPGIPHPIKSQLFEPFATSKAHGTGLGLYICREIVQKAGGDLLLLPSSTGALFRVRLPRAGP